LAISETVAARQGPGEIEEREGDVGGLAVHIAARICRLAGANEILVSPTLPGLVVGAGSSSSNAANTNSRAFPASGACSPSTTRGNAETW
jgi:class 3 adenylate cyclase